MKYSGWSVLILFFLFTLFGRNRNFDGESVRQEHALSFQQSLAEKQRELIAPDKALSLEQCIEIALANNLDVRCAEIGRRIAVLDRKVAFSYFLPQVNLGYQYTDFEPQPKVSIGGGSMAMHDKRIRDVTWQIQMSIFNPSTWYMYDMHQRGEEIADIAADYTRQMMSLQVTVLYYSCLSLYEEEKALSSQILASESLAEKMEALKDEGLVYKWQSDHAKVLLSSRRLQAKRAARLRDETSGQLLMAMGLSPLGKIRLSAGATVEPPEGELEDLIAEALLKHPRLRISDREVAIEQEKVKVALMNFVPSLFGFANRVNSSDSFQAYSNIWTVGLSGFFSVFNGFANINEYKATKEQVKKVAFEREQATLVMMLEVLEAYQNVETIGEQMDISKSSFSVSCDRYGQVYEQWEKGYVDGAELLSVVSERDHAEMILTNTRFQYQVAIATLVNRMGITDTESEEVQDGK